MLSYPEAVERLLELGHELHQMPSQAHKFDLDHMRVFAEALGHPEQTGPSALIAATNAIAFECFMRLKLDIAILEVGMGGRLDATNIVEPLLSVITDVDLDHQKF